MVVRFGIFAKEAIICGDLKKAKLQTPDCCKIRFFHIKHFVVKNLNLQQSFLVLKKAINCKSKKASNVKQTKLIVESIIS